jgi:hypothetical protein
LDPWNKNQISFSLFLIIWFFFNLLFLPRERPLNRNFSTISSFCFLARRRIEITSQLLHGY